MNQELGLRAKDYRDVTYQWILGYLEEITEDENILDLNHNGNFLLDYEGGGFVDSVLSGLETGRVDINLFLVDLVKEDGSSWTEHLYMIESYEENYIVGREDVIEHVENEALPYGISPKFLEAVDKTLEEIELNI